MTQKETQIKTPPSLPASRILDECSELLEKKARDYQNPNSSVKQMDYYPRGLYSIMDIIHAKYLRALSVMEAMDNDEEYNTNFESLEDSFRDLINYASFAVVLCQGDIDGQDSSMGLFSNVSKPSKNEDLIDYENDPRYT